MENKTTTQTLPETEFWHFGTDYWYKKLNSTDKGLSQKAAEEIFNKLGGVKNIRSGFKKDIFLLLSQFKSPLLLLLIGAIHPAAVD